MYEMQINYKSINEYGARLLSYEIGGTAITNYTAVAGRQYSLPYLLDKDLKPRKLTVTVTFSAAGTIVERQQKLTAQKAAFDRALMSSDTCNIWLPNGYYYDCLISSLGSLTMDSSGIVDVTYTFDAVQNLGLQRFDMINGNATLTCQSTVASPCKLEISNDNGSVTTVTVRQFGITAAIPLGKTLIIDGTNGTITMDGANAFGKLTNFLDFPRLQPGRNSLTLSGNSGTSYSLHMVVWYYPMIM